MFKNTTATQKIFHLNKRIRAVAGGTSASKTISILIWCIDYSQSSSNKLISVVSESYPHLEKGAMLDFENIMKASNYWDDRRWNKSRHTYTFESGTKIEFFSVDTYGKAHGPRRDILFINEANNLHYNIADQLIARTREIVWLDWNPSEEFWFYTEMLPIRTDVDFITLTYLDNEALDQITINEIESHKGNKSWWQVYGLGQLGEIETRVYVNWIIIDEIPARAKLVSRAMDFGYSNDPTAIVDIYKYNEGFIFDELFYRKGVANKDLAYFLLSLDDQEVLVIADSSEPKSIDEINAYGVNIDSAQKGPGSVNQGIQYVQRQSVMVTSHSLNLIKEYRNYLWTTDRNGKVLNKPEDINNHLMDAIRYGLETYTYAEVKSGLQNIYETKRQFQQTPVYSRNNETFSDGLDIRKILENKDNRTWKEI